jgi:Na+/melibiose symporter-like transporter
VLGAIGIIGAFFNNYSIETLLTNALFLVIWAWVLNWLCSKGFKAISWILVLLPFIMALFTYFLTKDVVAKEGFYEGFYEGLTPEEERRAQVQAELAAKEAKIKDDENKRKRDVRNRDAERIKAEKAAAAAAAAAEAQRRKDAYAAAAAAKKK